LRAIAAMSVAVFHACQWSGLDFAVGAAGVDLFFIISGFVLWNAVQEREITPGAFLLARFIRVAPLYWLMTLMVAALVLWRPQAMPVAQFEPGHLILSLLFIPHNDPAGDAFPLLPSGWTLTYEAFFYLVMALALCAPRDRRLQVLCGTVLIAALLGLGYHALYPLLANPMLLEFLVGVGLARLWRSGTLRRAPLAVRWGWTGLGVGGAALIALQLCGVRDDLWRPLLWGVPAALVVGGALVLEVAGALRQGRIGRALEHLGDASYSLYLVQLPVVCAFAWFARSLAPVARAPTAFALAIGAGLICYRLIERPLGRVLASGVRRGGIGGHPLDRHGLGRGPAPQEALAAVDPDPA
jgi:exopolysaccharide production protein ExoZ